RDATVTGVQTCALPILMPMVAHLNRHGIDTELWFENQPKHAATIQKISVPQRHVDSDFTFNPWTFLRRLNAYRRELRAVCPKVRSEERRVGKAGSALVA